MRLTLSGCDIAGLPVQFCQVLMRQRIERVDLDGVLVVLAGFLHVAEESICIAKRGMRAAVIGRHLQGVQQMWHRLLGPLGREQGTS